MLLRRRRTRDRPRDVQMVLRRHFSTVPSKMSSMAIMNRTGPITAPRLQFPLQNGVVHAAGVLRLLWFFINHDIICRSLNVHKFRDRWCSPVRQRLDGMFPPNDKTASPTAHRWQLTTDEHLFVLPLYCLSRVQALLEFLSFLSKLTPFQAPSSLTYISPRDLIAADDAAFLSNFSWL
ncbi:hypothetical protein RB195_009987 [Necator americanus]|uniref:Animal hem peroxidase n=1 Tax=Necator americanus TaxID=51031 RepID=A0ABR1CVT6_NECAM